MRLAHGVAATAIAFVALEATAQPAPTPGTIAVDGVAERGLRHRQRARLGSAQFAPGDGRAFYAGLEWRLP